MTAGLGGVGGFGGLTVFGGARPLMTAAEVFRASADRHSSFMKIIAGEIYRMYWDDPDDWGSRTLQPTGILSLLYTV